MESSSSFEMNPIQLELQKLTRRFVQSQILPAQEEDEKSGSFRRDLIESLGELGLTGIPLSESYGGAGLGYEDYIVAMEELAAGSLGYAISVAVTGLTQVILNQFGNDEQKQKYIPPLASGKAIGAFSLSEPGSGSDAAALRTTAKKKGNHYILNGTKLWATQADTADTVIVMARTGAPDSGAKGISSFIIEKGMRGFQCGKQEKKMGMNISHTMEIILNDVEVPASHLVGAEGDGLKIALAALDCGRITIAASALGISRAALKIAIEHAQQREQFGRPIAEFQGISFLLADMAVQWDAASLLTRRAAWLKDQGKPFSQEAAMAKLFATDMAMRVTTDAVQVLGGSGYTQDFPVERFMREAKVLQIVEGTNQIQRMIIGKNLTQRK